MQQLWTKEQPQVDTWGGDAAEKEYKIVAFKAECPPDLIIGMLYVNSHIPMIKVLNVWNASAETDTKALSSKADTQKKNRNTLTLCQLRLPADIWHMRCLDLSSRAGINHEALADGSLSRSAGVLACALTLPEPTSTCPEHII